MHPLYAELKEIRRGPHATVYRARDQLLGRDVAVKELHPWADRSAAAVARFRFARAQGHLQHPHLLATHIADAEHGRLAMDFFAEGSFADRIERDGALSPAQVRQVAIDVLEALTHLHRHGLLHGAVKPSNLFVDSRGCVLLADGVGLTLTGHRPATYPQPITPQEEKYLAPEGTASGARAELYSVGLTLLELLLGNDFELLFPEVLGKAMTWMDWHRSDRQLPPVQTLVPALPRTMAMLLERLLRKRPEERYASAAEALESIRPSPHGYRRWGGPAWVAGGCIAAVVLGILLLLRPWETQAASAGADPALVQEMEKQRADLLAARTEATAAQKQIKALEERNAVLTRESKAALAESEAHRLQAVKLQEEAERAYARLQATLAPKQMSIGQFLRGLYPQGPPAHQDK
jgi:serine/threonine protein kinase